MANVIGSEDLGTDQTNQNSQQNGQSQNNATQAGQAPSQTSGNAPAITSGNVNNPNQQKGSGYTNIQSVLKANQGNQLGSAVGNNIQQTSTSAQDNLKNAQNQFNTQTQANQANTQQNQQLAQNVLNDPTQAVNNNQGQQFQTLLSGQYQGPTNLQNASQLQNQAQNAAQQGQALSSVGGRIGLLQQLAGNNQYGSGAANLDNLLLGSSNSPALQAAKRQALTLQGQVGSAIQGAQAQGQQATNQAQQFGTALQNQLGNTVQNTTQNLQQKASNAQADRNTQYQNALKDLQSGNITQQEADTLGVTQGENVYNTLSGNNAAQFLKENPLSANVGNVASAQDYAKMQALQKLAGQYAPENAQNAFQNFQNPSQAGTFQNSQALTGDQAGLQNAIQSTQSNIQGILGTPQTALNNAQQLIRLQAGQFTPQDYQDAQQMGVDVANLAKTKFSGAFGGSTAQNQSWAAANLTNSQNALKAAQTQIQNQFGTPQTINIQQPQSQYPAITQAVQGNQEQFPTVS